MAAYRGGIRTILIPKENEKDVREIPRLVRKTLEIVPVEHMDQVLRHALVLENPDEFFRPMPAEEGGARVPAEQEPSSEAPAGA